MKRTVAAILAVVLLWPMLTSFSNGVSGSKPDPCAGYEDLNASEWYYDAASFVIRNGYMGSTSATALRFEPKTNVSRAMIACILYRIAERPEVTYQGAFSDVPDGTWFSEAVEWCAQNGLAFGKGAGKFDPNGNVTRQELAAFMMRLTAYLGGDTEGRKDLDSFADAAQVSPWAITSLQWAVDTGLIAGVGAGAKTLLAPTDNATRAELAVIIMRFVQKQVNPLARVFPNTDTEDLFSFRYDGKDSSELIRNWTKRCAIEETESGTLQQISWTDPESRLRVTLDFFLYSASNAVEWVAHIENTGEKNTPMIENFQIADFNYQINDPTLSFSKGTDIREDDFLFVQEPLRMYANRTFAPKDGRSSSGDCMPYFNLSSQDGGCFLAIGWSGQWETSFRRTADGVRITAGMQKTHFVLYPGEAVRTPSFTVLKWDGTEKQSYGLWRAHMLAAHTPKNEDGSVVTLPVSNGAWGGDNEQGHLNTIRYISVCGYDYDAYWVDAGWYGDENNHSSDQFGDEWFKNAGDWYHNTTLYPNGLSPVSDAAHSAGMDFLLWFEPERAWWDSKLVREHPAWFLTCGETENTSFLFNMGDPEARQWMTDFISQKIKEYGVNIYRQDFNVAPLPYWNAADASDRQGITEMKYIEGLYAYLQGLAEQNPGLVLDNCAGGGRRLDYEILTYALPMFRSDYQCFGDYKTTPCQVQTDGLSHWVPLSGTCTQLRPKDTYSFRSNLAYAMQTPATDQIAWQRAMLEQFHTAQPYYTGDYYRVSSGSVQSESDWYAYQMHNRDSNTGFILAFRREKAANETETLKIYVPASVKQITLIDADSGEKTVVSAAKATGSCLLLPVTIGDTTASKLLFYEMN